MTELTPSREEQAEEIIRLIQEDPRFDLSDEITPADIIDNIDPEKPVSVNLKTVLDAFKEAL